MQMRKEWWLMVLLAGAVHAAEPAAPAAKGAPAAAAATEAAPASPTAAAADPDARLPLDDLRTFVEVFERVRASYVEPVDDRTLFENAIRGMLSSLDPHSAYLDSKDFGELQDATTGEFEGIGLDVGMEEGVVKVVSPIDESPAAKAGIRAGDYIIKIDGKSVQGMTLSEAVDLMRGKPGTKLMLTVLRKGEEPRDLEVTRARVEVSSVKARVIQPGILAIRISQFQMHTGRDLRREIEKLKADSKTPVTGLVLDLRNNPGGVLDGAIAVSDLFLDSGRIVSTRGRTPESEQVFSATPGDILPGVPMAVLVNGGSASASEIVAGALQDNHRAFIVGTTTFGKGSVQTVLPLTAGKGIKLTTARYYTPSGRSIQAQGIKPDIEVPPAQVNVAEGADLFRESDLQRHLDNDAAAAATPAGGDKTPKEKPLVERDNQMAEAVNLLKAVAWQTHVAPQAAPVAAPAAVEAAPAPATKSGKPGKKPAPVRGKKAG
ncbi:MAG TPA: S41 family peptidase [Moraxellaceae bacterium]|nr:S41 family peptidase [Moraxellaceae bacterium]